MHKDDVFALIATERSVLANVLDGLTDDQWESPSLCVGWRVREVVAHLVMPFHTAALLRIGFRMVLRRGDFDRVADEWARGEKRSNRELVAALRDNAGHRFVPPGGGPENPLTDVVTHALDITRPLGLAYAPAPEAATVVLDNLVSVREQRMLGGGSVTDGLAFTGSDTGWRHGEGLEVRGPAAALICAVGRRCVPTELTGDGVAVLRERLAAASR